MNDAEKTKEQLIEELIVLRRKINELEKGDAKTSDEYSQKRIKVSDYQFRLSIAVILVLGCILPIAGSMFLSYYMSDMHWVGIPAHTILETLGSFAGLLLSVFILSSYRANKIPSYYIWISCGLIALGILDGFDGYTYVGQTSLRMHDVSILMAGFLFAMVWLSNRINISKLNNKLPIVIAIISILLGVFTAYTYNMESMWIGEHAFPFIGGILFLSAAVYLIIHYKSDHCIEDFLFATFCILYGWAGLSFAFSHMWNADWWFWHIVRLTAYFVVMSYMFITFQRSEEKMLEQAALLDNAHDAIEVMDLDDNFIYWNKGAERLYGLTLEDIVGKNAIQFLCKDDKEHSKFTNAKKSVLEKGKWTGEFCRVNKDGKIIFVESSWTLVRNNRDKPKSILVINTDITDKKKIESQFLRAQRLESIGILAGGIAHDLNNVMTPIMLSIEMLKEKFVDDESQRFIAIIERNANRGANLIKQVLLFARGVEGERKSLQMSYVISEIKKMIKDTFPKNIQINMKISNDLWMIFGDITQLQQVLMNLCVNARDAMPNGGILNISAENIQIDDSQKFLNVDAHNGPYIRLTVSDTGTGIPANVIDKIFDPFFTTKDKSKGTGLGLSIAMSIIKGHGGFINVDSEVGKGTSFDIYLPAVKTESQNIEVKEYEINNGDGQLILIVDDEYAIKEITVNALQRHGYNTITADNGSEAVDIYSKNKNKIKLILMDMMMPIMDGQDSIKNIRKIDENVKIIAVSGATDKDKFDKISDKDVQAFLPKPYRIEKLLKVIHEALSE